MKVVFLLSPIPDYYSKTKDLPLYSGEDRFHKMGKGSYVISLPTFPGLVPFGMRSGIVYWSDGKPVKLFATSLP